MYNTMHNNNYNRIGNNKHILFSELPACCHFRTHDEEKISFKYNSSNGYILKKVLFTKMKIMLSKTRTFVNKEKTSLKYSEQTTFKLFLS